MLIAEEHVAEHIDIQRLRGLFRYEHFSFIFLASSDIVTSIRSRGTEVFVVGEPDKAAYEWIIIQHDTDRVAWSDRGYSSVATAARDALILTCDDVYSHDVAGDRSYSQMSRDFIDRMEVDLAD